MQVLTDNELIGLYKTPNTKQSGFKKIVDKYKEKLYWHIRRMVVIHEDADDVLQNTFLKIWNKLEDFRAESALYTWMYKIATNESLAFLANKNKHHHYGLETLPNLTENIKAESFFDEKKLEWKLQLAIQELPAKQRAVFNLRYYDEMPYEQMSEILDTSVGALKASYFHAAKKIEAFILKAY